MYIGNLPKDAVERDLERFFRGFGRVRDVLIKNGYGFVEFDDSRDAEDAVYELNGKRLLGERVTVERARGTPRGRDQWTGGRERYRSYQNERYGPPTRTDYRLIVENLSSRVSWQDLKDYMRQAGEVTYADAHKNKNEGVVEFATYTDMKNALDKLDDTEVNGRRIRLVEDRRHGGGNARRSHSYSSRSRSRSRSKRRSRSASRSRSRSRKSSHSKSKSKSPRHSRSKSRSASHDKSRSRSKSQEKHSKERSRSVSPDRKPNSRSQSPEK